MRLVGGPAVLAAEEDEAEEAEDEAEAGLAAVQAARRQGGAAAQGRAAARWAEHALAPLHRRAASLHGRLPISPHISSHLPISPHISPYLPTSPHISPHLPTSQARRRAARPPRVALPERASSRGARSSSRITLTLTRSLTLTLTLTPRGGRGAGGPRAAHLAALPARRGMRAAAHRGAAGAARVHASRAGLLPRLHQAHRPGGRFPHAHAGRSLAYTLGLQAAARLIGLQAAARLIGLQAAAASSCPCRPQLAARLRARC